MIFFGVNRLKSSFLPTMGHGTDCSEYVIENREKVHGETSLQR